MEFNSLQIFGLVVFVGLVAWVVLEKYRQKKSIGAHQKAFDEASAQHTCYIAIDPLCPDDQVDSFREEMLQACYNAGFSEAPLLDVGPTNKLWAGQLPHKDDPYALRQMMILALKFRDNGTLKLELVGKPHGVSDPIWVRSESAEISAEAIWQLLEQYREAQWRDCEEKIQQSENLPPIMNFPS